MASGHRPTPGRAQAHHWPARVEVRRNRDALDQELKAAQQSLEDAFKPALREKEQAHLAAYRQRKERRDAATKLGLDPHVWDEYESACVLYQRYGGDLPPNPAHDLGAWERWQYAQRWLSAAGRT